MLRGEIIPLQCRGVMSSCGWGPRIYATPYPGVAGSEQTRRLQYKNTNFLVLLLLLLILSQRYYRKCWEKHLPCWLPGGNAIKPVNSKLVAKYMLSQALSNLEIGLQALGGVLGLGVRLLPLSKRPVEFVAVMEKEV